MPSGSNKTMSIKPPKIAVVGLGYVGLSNAVLLAQHNQVVGVDINPEKVTVGEPVGPTSVGHGGLKPALQQPNVLFRPEFLREGNHVAKISATRLSPCYDPFRI